MGMFARIKKLEERMNELESKFNNKPKRKEKLKSQIMKEWIYSLFEDEENIEVWKIMQLGKEEGYSQQMLQKIRHEFCPNIIPVPLAGKRWFWKKLNKQALERWHETGTIEKEVENKKQIKTKLKKGRKDIKTSGLDFGGY